MGRIDCHIALRPLLPGPDQCGDVGLLLEYGDECLLTLVDALGHGGEAYRVACLAKEFVSSHFREDPAAIVTGLHGHLKGTRGAVAAICRLNLRSGNLAYVGIGNITVRVFGARPVTFVPRSGVVGYMMPAPRVTQAKLLPGDLLLMHSDGIHEHRDPAACGGLFRECAEAVSSGLLALFGKEDDDASCIALRYLP